MANGIPLVTIKPYIANLTWLRVQKFRLSGEKNESPTVKLL